MKKKYDIVLIGAIADIDLIYANAILSQTKNLNLLIVRKTKYKISDDRLKLYPYLSDEYIYYNDSSVRFFFRIALKTKIILSFTGSILGQLKLFFLYKIITGHPKIMNRTTGADFREFLYDKNIYKYIYKIHLKFCDTHNISSMVMHIENSIKIQLKDVFFLSVPFVKTLKFKEEYTYNYIFKKNKEKIIFFMPSHILFQDKKNMTFLIPFIKSLKFRKDIFCILIDIKNKDVNFVKEMIINHNVEDSFFWIPQRLEKEELHNYIIKSDIIIDQFNVGSLGGIAIETMLLNKNLMTYLSDKYSYLLYSSMPPIINYNDENKIFDFILKIQKEDLIQNEERIKNWVVNELSNKKIVLTLLYHASRISGDKTIMAKIIE